MKINRIHHNGTRHNGITASTITEPTKKTKIFKAPLPLTVREESGVFNLLYFSRHA